MDFRQTLYNNEIFEYIMKEEFVFRMNMRLSHYTHAHDNATDSSMLDIYGINFDALCQARKGNDTLSPHLDCLRIAGWIRNMTIVDPTKRRDAAHWNGVWTEAMVMHLNS